MDGITKTQRVPRTKLQAAKNLRRDMTVEERQLWTRLRRSRLGGLHFRRQQIIQGFVVDFYCHRARLVVELDGAGHAQRADYDDARDAVLEAAGLSVLRIANRALKGDLAGTLAKILDAATRRLPGVPPSPRGRGTGG